MPSHMFMFKYPLKTTVDEIVVPLQGFGFFFPPTGLTNSSSEKVLGSTLWFSLDLHFRKSSW